MVPKIKVLLIFFVAGILPVHAERYSSGGEAIFVGAMQGLLLMLVFWIWRVIKGGKSKTNDISKETNQSTVSTIPQPQLTPWEKFKRDNDEDATAIEMSTQEDLRNLSEKMVLEKVSTFKRMATQLNCSISEVKETAIKELLDKFDKEELSDVLSSLEEKANFESVQYRVLKENTVSNYTGKWLREFLQANQGF